MEIIIGAIVIILIIKIGWRLIEFVFEHWAMSLLIIAVVLAYFAA